MNRKGEPGGWGEDGEKGGLENDICSRQPMHRAQSTTHTAHSTTARQASSHNTYKEEDEGLGRAHRGHI